MDRLKELNKTLMDVQNDLLKRENAALRNCGEDDSEENVDDEADGEKE